MSPWLRPLAALAYLLPWADAVGFGNALFRVVPSLQWLALPTLPVVLIERGLPFGGFILFLVLYLAVARNARVPEPVRFHVLQAILLDILLIVIGLAFQVLLRPLGIRWWCALWRTRSSWRPCWRCSTAPSKR